MGIRKSKKVKITWEQQEITYDVDAECPYCGEINKDYITDDDQRHDKAEVITNKLANIEQYYVW